MRRLCSVLLFLLFITGVSAATLEVFVTGSRTINHVTYGQYPYHPSTNYEYNLLVIIPALNYTNQIQRTSTAKVTYGDFTNYVAGKILDYATAQGANTNNLTILFKRPQ